MYDIVESETYWLTLTNIALGVVTLVCVIAVARAVFKELSLRVRSRVRVPIVQDDHAFQFSDLGITMADGGNRIDEFHIYPCKKDDRDDNEQHITRSEN